MKKLGVFLVYLGEEKKDSPKTGEKDMRSFLVVWFFKQTPDREAALIVSNQN